MERIRQMSLKRALFTIAFIHIAVAFLLSAISFWVCVELNSAAGSQGIVIGVQSDLVTIKENSGPAERADMMELILSVLQIFLPVLICTLALFSTASMFYRLKLKEPLAVLADGAMRIIDRDLDFTMEAKSGDELGQLITAFETMRKTLLDNNRELWRQAEERRRLNAAFAHNLRNPVTVLKGSVKLAKRSITGDGAQAKQLAGHLSLMGDYTDRIERYIETMSNIQKLEEIPLTCKLADWDDLVRGLEKIVRFLGADSGRQMQFEAAAYPQSVLIDESVLYQITENLVSNALRFARQHVSVSCLVNGEMFELAVTDDGCGFPPALIKKGIRPFQKGKEEAGHFGMGLYICELLAKKHGGDVTVSSQQTGAVVLASLKIK